VGRPEAGIIAGRPVLLTGTLLAWHVAWGGVPLGSGGAGTLLACLRDGGCE